MPADVRIINRPKSIVAEHFWYIAGTIAFCGIESALIIYLLLNRNKRKKVEKKLRGYRTELENWSRSGPVS